MSDKLILIKKRPDFLHVTHNGYKVVRSGFVLQAAFSRRHFPAPVYRIGYTASKKIGNAVCRNRAKRRLRAVCRALLPLEAVAGYDYVIIARHATLDMPYKRLYKELKFALIEIKQEFNDVPPPTGEPNE
ncbi:MAG: ribonuclease P protein component [Alphaproteobacteria bacterium]|nr:ribonuclease P protein component [Alphaproteobacteria bacterium]